MIILFLLCVLSVALGKDCCPQKRVGETTYILIDEYNEDMSDNGCKDGCIYQAENDPDNRYCFGVGGNLPSHCLSGDGGKCSCTPKKYCQPNENCWPKPEEVEDFSIKINGTTISCLGLPKFVNNNFDIAHKIKKNGLPYNGLLNNSAERILDDHIIVNPYKEFLNKAETLLHDPFITGAYYKNVSVDDVACMTPFQYLNNRNYKKEWMAAFVVTANTTDDVIQALTFANTHNLSVAVMATGHELQDRNAGPGPNSLLIRTTCFREFEAKFEDIGGYNNSIWSEGYAIVGAGLTFGPNFWYNIKNAEGLYPLAYDVNRTIVGGSCHSVGIVGWVLGGGKGLTTPMYGLGVDNLLHVDMVLANGNNISANFTTNTELFKAIRGGGPGFGVITSLKIKLHKPICGTKNCYQVWRSQWNGTWTGENDQINDIKKVLTAIFNWTATYNEYWNSMVGLSYNKEKKKMSLIIQSVHFGYEEGFNSFKDTLQHLNITNTEHLFNGEKVDKNHPPIITDKFYCDFDFKNDKNQSNCYTSNYTLHNWPQSIRFLVNSSTTTKRTKINGKETNEFLDALITNWQPLCDKQPFSACASGFQFHYFFTDGKKKYDTGGSISYGFRNAITQVYNSGVHSNRLNMTFEQKESWMHYTLAPAMYKFSNASYFNEAEYTLNPGQWEDRFWGKKIYGDLLKTKKIYDPEYRINCRHCVGSEIV